MSKRRDVTLKYIGGHPYVVCSFGHKQITFKRNVPKPNIPYDMFEELTNDNPTDFEVVEDKKPEVIDESKETEETKKRGRPRKAE